MKNKEKNILLPTLRPNKHGKLHPKNKWKCLLTRITTSKIAYKITLKSKDETKTIMCVDHLEKPCILLDISFKFLNHDEIKQCLACSGRCGKGGLTSL